MLRTAARSLPLAALLLFVAGLALRPMAESDLFFHLKAGQEILARHGLPGRNLYSFTYPDYPDLDTSWLAEVGGALVYGRGGFPAVVLAKTLVLLATFAGAYVVCRRRGAGALASVLALAAAAFVGRDRFVERPHIFSFAGEVATLAAIDAVARRAGPAAARAGLAFLAAVVLWANLHAGVFVAPLLLGAAAIATAVAERRGRSAPAGEGDLPEEGQRDLPAAGRLALPPAAGRLALMAVGAALAALVTPVGFGLVRYLRLHLTIPALHPVDEFRSPTWLSDAPLFIYGGVLLAAGGWLVRDHGRSAWRLLAPVLVMAALAAKSVRFGADLALVAAPILAVVATSAAARLFANANANANLGARLPARLRELLAPPIPTIATVALLAGFAIAPHTAAGGPHLAIGLDEDELPLAAIDFVNQNGLRDRMYNDFEIGSYLLFDPVGGYPKHRVFVDPRLPAYPLELHRLLGRADLTRDEWQAAMDRYGVESALLAYAGLNRRVAWWDPARWALVWNEADARVFVRRLPRYRDVIAAHEIPATFTFTAEDGAATQPLTTRPAASPVSACEWNRRLGDLFFQLDGALTDRARAAYTTAMSSPPGCLAATDEARLGAWLGAVALGAKKPAEALPLLERALSAGDRALTTFTDRASALEALGRNVEAAEAWRDVATRAGESALAVRARARAARLGQ